MTRYECWNCEAVTVTADHDYPELAPINDLFERVDPGDEMPAGECTICGCLVYKIEQPPAPPNRYGELSAEQQRLVDTFINALASGNPDCLKALGELRVLAGDGDQ